jgi:hypothetical protein
MWHAFLSLPCIDLTDGRRREGRGMEPNHTKTRNPCPLIVSGLYHWNIQRHTLRDRRPSMAVFTACWAMGYWGQRNWNSVRGEKNVLYWADKSSRGRTKISWTSTTSPANQPRKNPFHLSSLSPHSPQFQTVSRGHPSLVSLEITNKRRGSKDGDWPFLVSSVYTFSYFEWNGGNQYKHWLHVSWETVKRIERPALIGQMLCTFHLPSYTNPRIRSQRLNS